MNSQNSASTVLHLPPRKIVRLATGFSALILALGYLRYAQLLFGVPIGELGFMVLDFDSELSLPAWYTSALLACSAALLLWTFGAERKLQTRTSMGWLILGIGFMYLSADEMISIHERYWHVAAFLPFDADIFYFKWVIVGIAVVVTLGIGFLPFLRRLPLVTSRRLVIAGAVYVTGALGMELVGGSIAANYGHMNLPYIAVTTLEETLEIIGATLGLRAVALHLGEVLGGTILHLATPKLAL